MPKCRCVFGISNGVGAEDDNSLYILYLKKFISPKTKLNPDISTPCLENNNHALFG